MKEKEDEIRLKAGEIKSLINYIDVVTGEDMHQVMSDSNYDRIVKTLDWAIPKANEHLYELQRLLDDEKKMDGILMERNLVNRFNAHPNTAAIRLAASGGGSQENLPDVLVTNREREEYYAIELKSTSGEYTNPVTEEELCALRAFSEDWRALPLVCFRFSYDTEYYALPADGTNDIFNNELNANGGISGKKHKRDKYFPINKLIYQ